MTRRTVFVRWSSRDCASDPVGARSAWASARYACLAEVSRSAGSASAVDAKVSAQRHNVVHFMFIF